MSERTIYRYFATREQFLDAVAQEVRQRIDLPPNPTSVDELLAYPALLFGRFEAKRALTRAALHGELFGRMQNTQARERWTAVQRIVDTVAPRRSVRDRRMAAANIRYFLAATTWNYYREYFGFSLEETSQSATQAIRATLDLLVPPVRRADRRRE